MFVVFFFFNDTATTEIYTLSLHDALPIWSVVAVMTTTAPATSAASLRVCSSTSRIVNRSARRSARPIWPITPGRIQPRSEEHTSELQSRQYLVCRLLLEKKNKQTYNDHIH